MPTAHPRTLAGVPLLIAVPYTTDAPLPVVLWCHGFRADALAHAAELERCAALGFLAVGIDAVGHGARVDPSLSRRVAQSPDGALGVMLDLVEESVQELPALLSALATEYEIDRARVSMVGISMGAFLAYRAIGAGIPLRTVVALLGSPEWQRETSPDRTPDVFHNVSLLSITAEHDANVPPHAVQRLHAALRAEDTGNGVHPHHHYVIRGAGHLMNGDEWQRAMRVTTQWLQRMA